MLRDESFDDKLCTDTVNIQFGEEMQCIADSQVLINAIGALINYLKETQKNGLERINKIELYSDKQYMNLDYNTQRNLELTATMLNKEKRGSLLWVLDKTKTAMGKRLIRSWLEHPLLNVSAINNRQSAVEELVNNNMLRLDIMDALSGIFDIERLMTRIVYGSANGRELRSLAAALQNYRSFRNWLLTAVPNILKRYIKKLTCLKIFII